MDFTTAMLQERKKTHGRYDENASCAIGLIVTLEDHLVAQEEDHQKRLTAVQLHALHMICHKIARIVTGDPNFQDHWDDIGGYAELAARWCAPAKVEEPTGCADDCVHPSHRFSSEVQTTSVQEKKRSPVNGADVLAAKEDHQNEDPAKLPCYCNGGACMMEHGGTLKYVYCKKAENADKKVPRYLNETSNQEPAEG